MSAPILFANDKSKDDNSFQIFDLINKYSIAKKHTLKFGKTNFSQR